MTRIWFDPGPSRVSGVLFPGEREPLTFPRVKLPDPSLWPGEPEWRLGGRPILGFSFFGVTCGWVFRFCKQPLEVGENIRDERGPPRIFGGRCLRKQDQKITGLGHGFTPAGGRCGGKKNVQFLLAQRCVGGVDHGELTPQPSRFLRGHPSSTIQIDCVPHQNLLAFSGLQVDRAKTQRTQPRIH